VKPGRNQHFSFENSVDLLWKLYWEIERLHHASPHDIIDMKCFAFNAAVTAWQLADWIFEDMTSEQRLTYNTPNLGTLQAKVRTECRSIYLCRQIATASKHRSVTVHFDPQVSTVTAVEQTPPGEWAKWRLVVNDGSTTTPALDVFEDARLYWYHFLEKLGLIF
jgi:hypothetical protein